ncbi:hypothetical protein BST83_06075 [Polaribacter filamentus]|jgi:hypothetical protein|uniref:Uncharacterized protein n=1 Tax=Polaribacter filamentus TaxID=53483 RepID=A0A2S7KVY0_9FLAO|nr:hypothetical protein BST83_06075 [Polaribacter filamentus]
MFNSTNSYSKYLVAFVAFAFTLIKGVDFIELKLGIEINYHPYFLLVLIITFFLVLSLLGKIKKPQI